MVYNIQLEPHQVEKIMREELNALLKYLKQDYDDPHSRIKFEDKQVDRIFVSDSIAAVEAVIEWYTPKREIKYGQK